MNSYDIGNIRHDANFNIPVFSDVFWVPFNVLGKSKYTNSEISISPKKVRGVLTTPYEITQYIKNADYTRVNDVKIDKNLYSYVSGSCALIKKEGSCASFSGVFYYLLHDIFDTYNMCILNNKGTGHALNFIKHGNNIYFYDLYSQLNEFSNAMTVESGNKLDFVKSVNMFASCLKTNDIRQYIKLIEKKNILKKREWLFYVTKSITVPPVYIEHISHEDIYVKIDKRDLVEWYIEPSVKKITLDIV